MRIKNGFVLREICGEKVVSGEGANVVDFTKLIRLNETSAYLWNEIQGKEFDAQMLADLLCERYEVAPEVALADCEVLVSKMVEAGIIE